MLKNNNNETAESSWSNISLKLINRSSRSQLFFKIGVLKNVANSTGIHLNKASSPQAYNYKSDSNTGIFQWNFRNSYQTIFFCRTPQRLLLNYFKNWIIEKSSAEGDFFSKKRVAFFDSNKTLKATYNRLHHCCSL